MKLSRLLSTAVLAVVTAISSFSQDTISFSYVPDGSALLSFGTVYKENYDVAIRISDANLVGKQITDVTVPLVSVADLSGFKVWLSKELTLETVDGVKQNAPDVVSVDAVPEGDLLTVTFAEPYTITDEGVYVGYSFNVDSLTDDTASPVVVSAKTDPDGFYLHTSSSYYSWMRMEGYVSAISVGIVGDFYQNSVGIASFGEQYAEAGKAGEARLTLVQNGSAAVTSIDYSYDVAGLTGTDHYELTEPLGPQYDGETSVALPLPAVTEIGSYPLTVTITKVNGTDNVNAAASATATLSVLPFVPVHRPLLEVYTSMGCGYCPRALVGLELMNEKYPDLFVGLFYHSGGVLGAKNAEWPTYIQGTPTAWLDRVRKTDAYHGDDQPYKTPDNPDYGFNLDDVYLARAAEITPASVAVTADWADGSQQTIDVTGTVTFAKDVSGVDYRLAYILVADDLHGEGDDWRQSNYYRGDDRYAESEGMDMYVNGKSIVYGLHYNDVAVLSSDAEGIEGGLPSDFETGVAETCTYQFNVADAVNLEGQPMIQDKSKLRVVAVLVDADTGEVINSNKCNVGQGIGTGISAAETAKGGVKSIEYFDASGRRVTTPSGGLYIKSVRYADGTVKTSKVVLK